MKYRTMISNDRNRGAALVIILAFVVLMTGLVVAFFSRALTERQVSNSSANQTKADILARGGLALVLGSLKQEIAYGSSMATPAPSPAAGVVYVPASNLYMKPVRDTVLTGGANTMPNLVRVSGTTQMQINGHTVPGEASAVLATGTSPNGRTISLDKWNSHYLIPLSGTSIGDSTPVSDFKNDIPSWVMVTTSGTQVLTSPTNTVTGRYAYAIYDESLLLDMNVAGYPASSGTTSIGGKSSLAYADLAQIGILNTGATRQTDNMLGWRNYATLQPPSQSLGSYNFSGSSMAITGTKYDKYITSATNGFLSTSGTIYNNRTDQMFTSRQALIKFARAQTISGTALQFMGTFSRAVMAPSWKPVTVTTSTFGTSTVDYTGQADAAASANRNLLNMRFLSSGTISVAHYNDDATPANFSAQGGDPLLQRKFSLAKVAWLGHNGLNTSAFPALTAQAVLDCFGLTWNDSKKRWDYNHGDPNKILTLAQVVQANREPDFFELLKAGILNGSLGGNPGAGCTGPLDGTLTGAAATAATTGVLGLGFESYSGNADMHIRQIGANIIDQADSDNYPTAIYQLNVTSRAGMDGTMADLYNTVFGQENLPMLSRVGTVMCYIPDHTGANIVTPGPEGFWLKPEVWNPNESTTANPANYPTPTVLRLVTYGSCYTALDQGDGADHQTGPTTDFGTDPSNPQTTGIIQFKNPSPVPASPSSPAPYPFFNNPVSLEGWFATDSNWSGEYNYYSGTTSDSNPMNRYPQGKTSSWDSGLHHDPFLAVWAGQIPNRDPATYVHHNIQLYCDPFLTFVLEYNDGSRWAPYSVISRIDDMPNAGGGSTKYGRTGWWNMLGHVDPRTDRFSVSYGGTRAGGNPSWDSGSTLHTDPTATGIQADYGAPSGRGVIGGAWPRTTAGFSHASLSQLLFDSWQQNNPNSDFRYADLDGITRPGDAWRAAFGAGSTGDGAPLSHWPYPVPATGGTPPAASRRRPVVLNRPFRSVGELGYVFRDQPWKSLDFWSPVSADSGLLDLFSIHEQPTVMAGLISPSAPAPVLQAVISAAMKQENPVIVTSGSSEASAAAQAIVTEITANGPLTNPAECATRLGSPLYTALTASAATNTPSDPRANDNKRYGETVMRGLSQVTNTRTWNLMIDLIAQSGRMAPNAKTLDDFVVEGEKRYWLHVAIDRYTGKIIDQQLEPVYD